MTATAPIAIEMLEDAIHDWVAAATGIPGERVCFVEPRDSGAPDVALPAALIEVPTSLVAIGQPEIRKVPSIVQQKITIRVSGPASFGVLLYVGWDFDSPTTISYVSGAVEVPTVVRAGLLAELASDLPAGVTAIADPADVASIIVTGSTAVPLFALAPVNTVTVAITPLVERFPEVEAEWSRMVCRVTFRGSAVRGFATGFDLMTRAKKAMHRVLEPLVHRAGWRLAGILFAQPTTIADRSESQATLDFALEGYATAVYQLPAARQIGIAFAHT